MKGPRKAPLPWAVLALAVIVAGVFAIAPGIRQALDRSRLANALGHARQVKFALDGFAADHYGQFPNQDTGVALGLERFGFDSSNDYFRQLFVSGATESEAIFWCKNSSVAGKRPPDDVIRTDGQLDPDLILQPGDVHWAYWPEARNTSEVGAPLLADPFLPGTTRWDPARETGKAMVMRIDGSAKALRLDPGDTLPASSDAAREFSKACEALVQPEPGAP
jgi:hypothetical protein